MTLRRRVAMVGFAGHQGSEYTPVLQQVCDVVAGVDTSPDAQHVAADLGLRCYRSAEALLDNDDFDTAVVTVPHHAHLSVCTRLLAAGKHVIKEKPFAMTQEDARALAQLARAHGVSVTTLTQRPFRDDFAFAFARLSEIGQPYWFSYDYHLNLATPTEGWRARRQEAHGGVLLDMGYHAIDVINRLFPGPVNVSASLLHCYAASRLQGLEDLVTAHFDFRNVECAGDLHVSRHSFIKDERLTVYGSDGVLTVEPVSGRATLHNVGGGIRDECISTHASPDVTRRMFEWFLARLDDEDHREQHVQLHLQNVRTCDLLYSCGRSQRVPPSPRPIQDAHSNKEITLNAHL